MSSLFNGETQTTETTNTQPTQPDLTTLLAGIKNEQGTQKYTSIEEALKGTAHAQNYIRELQEKLAAEQAEKARLAQEAAKVANIDEVVSKLAAQLQAQQTQSNPTTEVKGLDEQAVLNLVSKSLEQSKLRDVAQQNLAQVEQHLSNKFGDKAKDAIADKARELGIAPEKLGELAQMSPQLIIQLFGTTQGSGAPKLSTSSVHIPLNTSNQPTLEKPTKSMLAGSTDRERVEYMKQVRAYVNAKLGVTEDLTK